MAITFSCEGCGKQYTVKDELAGKRAQCKKCNAVMKVPTATKADAHREPDLRAETVAGGTVAGGTVAGGTVAGGTVAGRTAAGSDTVAGTVHALHGESLSGRSVSGSIAGKSVAGKSLSGRSMAGGSAAGRPAPADRGADDMAATPGTDQYSYADAYRAKMQAKNKPAGGGGEDGDGPSLEALKHVAASKEGALAYAEGEGDVVRRTRGPAAKNYASMEPISFLLTAALVGVLAYAVFGGSAAVPAGPGGKPYAPAVVADAGKPWALLIAPAAVFLVAAFAIVGPLVALAWFGALKIINVRLPGGLYFRSVGLAAVPLAAVALLSALPLNIDASNATLGALIGVPVGFVVLYYVHNQKPEVAGITTGLGAALATVGLLVTLNLADLARANTVQPYKDKLASAQKKKDEADRLAAIKKDEERRKAAITPEMAQAANAALEKATKDVAQLKTSVTTNKQQTREKLTATAAELSKSLAAAQEKFAYAERPEWAGLTQQVNDLGKQIDTFPSAVPPAEVAVAPEPGPDWSAKAGRREVSVAGYDLTPPNNATLDLDTTGGLVWRSADSKATLTIETIALPTPSQQRPWVAPAFVVNDAATKVVSIAADGAPPVEYGTVNGLPAAKVTVSDAKAGQAVVYTLHKDATWLKCTVAPVDEKDAIAAGFLNAVRSLHPRAEGVSPSDPFPATDLVGRYPNAKGDDAGRIVEMLKTKSNAEEAVVKAMGVSPDEASLSRYGPLLVATATEKSSRLLWRAAAGDNELASEARAALRRVDKRNADDIAFAVIDLKPGCNSRQVKAALDTLSNVEFSKERSQSVSRAFLTAIGDPQFIRTNAGPSLETALGKWANDDIASKMDEMLLPKNKGSVQQDERRTAMKVLAGTRKPKYADSILRSLTDDRDFVVETLIGMGTVATPSVATQLGLLERPQKDLAPEDRSKNRVGLIKVLGEVGDRKAFEILRSARDKGSPEVKDAAIEAIGRIEERMKSAKASANTPGVQPSASR